MISDLKLHPMPQGGSYTRTIEGNGGESELTICATSRQDGRTALLMAATDIDGVVLLHFMATGSRNQCIPTADLLQVLRREIQGWTHSGIAPTRGQHEGLVKAIDKIVRSIAKDWSLEG